MSADLNIASLLAPYVAGLNARQLEQVALYLDLLLRWNARMNLTAIRDPQEMVRRHFGESFFLASQGFVSRFAVTSGDNTRVTTGDNGGSVIDVGSGAGFPGIPIKILYPQLTVTLIEAQQRKAVFLREVLRAIGLDAEVLNLRAEAAVLEGRRADLVTMRAVEKFEVVLPVAADLVRPTSAGVAGGRLALLIGSAQGTVAERLLPTWRFEPLVAVPGAKSRGILWGHQEG